MKLTRPAAPHARPDGLLRRLARVPGVRARTAVPFAVVSGVHLVGQIGAGLGIPGMDLVHVATKPLLMPALGLVLAEGLSDVRARTGSLPRWTPLAGAALGFSWLGDLALMNQDWFLAGVGLFGVAQVAYATTFVRAGDASRTAGRPGLVAPYAVWWLTLLGVFGATEGVSPTSAAVAGYGALLGTMAFLAHRIGPLTAVGAATFVASDSLIGLGGSGLDLPLHGFWVMVTYLAAQWLIVRGLVEVAHDAVDTTDAATATAQAGARTT